MRSLTIQLILITILTFATCAECAFHSQYKGTYRIGGQYTINGKTYFPQYYETYEETGVASWYSEECPKCTTHETCYPCVTANGEFFNKNALTAAHRTLPMPSVVRVTNIKNGKSIKVVVNDRGPFKNGRILDVTERVAIELGFKERGLALVKIEYLPRSTEKLIYSKPHYKKSYRKIMEQRKQNRKLFLQNKNNYSRIVDDSLFPIKKNQIFKPVIPRLKLELNNII